MFLVYVFDGLRPDLVRDDLMPHLSAVRRRGTWFERSHCVFPTVTRVNAASLATGAYPSAHGIPSNTLYLPDAARASPFGTTGDVAVLRGLRATAEAALLAVPTTAEVLAEAGLRTVAVGTGSPGSTYLLNPEAARAGGATFHYAFSEPADLLATVQARLGPHAGRSTAYTVDNLVERVRYATRALVEVIAPSLEPELVYFWCTVPDALHHAYGLGSPEASAGLRRVDAAFQELIDGLEQLSGGPINVVVTSDHGYATVERHIDVAAELAAGGFGSTPGEGSLAVTVDGGAAHIFANGAGRFETERLVEFLIHQPWVAAVLAREPVPGGLPLTAALAECERAAAVVACLGWRHGDNGRGIDGLSLGGGGIAVGAGDHGGGSPFELRNTLVVAGPAFRPGASDLPAGIVDVAPTVCRVLGLQPAAVWSGRVLGEALADDGARAAPGVEEICSPPTSEGDASRLVVATTGATRYVEQAGQAG